MMKSGIERTMCYLSRFYAAGASLSMTLLFLVIFINSIRRYTIGKSLEWGEELPVFIAIYGVMFGAAWAYLQDRHIRFTILIGFLADKQKRYLLLLVDLCMIAISGLLAYSGWLFVEKRGAMETSGLIGLAKQLRDQLGWDWLIWIGHFYPYQLAIMLGGTMLMVAALVKFLSRLARVDANQLAEW